MIRGIDTTNLGLHPDAAHYVYTEYERMDRSAIAVGTIGRSPGQRLTSGAFDGNPCYTPDGKTILFSRLNRRGVTDFFDVWAMGADGSHPRRLVTGMHYSLYEDYVYLGEITPDSWYAALHRAYSNA